jgi:hypothetical protein
MSSYEETAWFFPTGSGALFGICCSKRHELRGGGGPKVENLYVCFHCFVAFILPLGVGKNKTIPSWKENGPNGH